MRILTLRPGYRALGFAAFPHDDAPATVQGTVRLATDEELPLALASALRQILEESLGDQPEPELVVLHGAHDGQLFTGPSLVTREAIDTLRRAMAAAPLHLPPTVYAAEALRQVLPTTGAVLVFETSFFATLPLRERLYALDQDTRSALRASRSGFQGLFHAEAAARVAHYRQALGRRSVARIASVCLEPKPELAAILGQRPMLVTSGATPLEGLPGEHTTGETDPGILLALARSRSLGPDELNELFTREGGLAALCGRAADLGEILSATDADTRLAREVFTHRLLIACGSAAAALGGLDALVFSGRYAAAGAALQGPLVSRLALALDGTLDVLTVEASLERILARAGVDAWQRLGVAHSAAAPQRRGDPAARRPHAGSERPASAAP